jgi:hypothetical protein
LEEDHLYAMQDYLSQYQQLVCRYRSENASLRRQLGEERVIGRPSREPQSAPRIIPAPTKPNNKEQSPSPDLQMPDVPPLKSTKSNGAWRDDPISAALASRADEPDRYATAATYQEPPRSRGTDARETAGDVLLSGEVVQNSDGGGPRLAVDIEPFDRSGKNQPFDGSISLMLVATGGGVPSNLGRWDFGPEDVRAALDSGSSEPVIRFHIELPAGTDVHGSKELWVRLAPTSGEKLLCHARVDLSEPGVFSSKANKLWASEESVVAASYVELSPQLADIAATVKESNWAVAQPGRPANLAPESDRVAGGWKASKEPLPEIAGASKIGAKPRVIHAPRAASPLSDTYTERAPQRPAWAPERAGRLSISARPTWSANR